MKTEKNPFGNSIGIVSEKSPFEGLSGKLISKLAFHMADIGMTGGMHFFDTGETIENTRRKCDSIICFGGKDIPGDAIHRLIASRYTPVVQIDFEGSHEALKNGRKFKTFGLGDLARMDLLPAVSTIPYTTPEEPHSFFCRNLGVNCPENQKHSEIIVRRITDLLGIKINSSKLMIELTMDTRVKAVGDIPNVKHANFISDSESIKSREPSNPTNTNGTEIQGVPPQFPYNEKAHSHDVLATLDVLKQIESDMSHWTDSGCTPPYND